MTVSLQFCATKKKSMTLTQQLQKTGLLAAFFVLVFVRVSDASQHPVIAYLLDGAMVIALLAFGETMLRHLIQWPLYLISKSTKIFTAKNVLPIALVLTTLIAGHHVAYAQEKVSIDDAMKRLHEGNQRFRQGKSIKPHQDFQRIKELAGGQSPFATIVGCSDSRVPNEIIFDQGLGDLFIIRTAGQVSTFASWGSIEFAEEILGTKLIVVLGHTQCGAVGAAVRLPEVPGHIVTLINAIKPAVLKAKEKQPSDLLDAAIRENILMQVEQLKNLEPVLAKHVRDNSIKIVGALYHLETGEVEFLNN